MAYMDKGVTPNEFRRLSKADWRTVKLLTESIKTTVRANEQKRVEMEKMKSEMQRRLSGW